MTSYPTIVLCIVFYILDMVCGSKAPNENITAIFAFGDSILDTGNNNYLKTKAKCNFLPYGRDFPRGVPTGRFCDGKVFTDLMAEGLGVKGLVPAYLDPHLQPSDLLTGVCFASGSSGLDYITANNQSVLTVSDQLNMFRESIFRIKTQVGERRSKSIISNAFFLISFGNNDIAFTYYSGLRPEYNIFSYTTYLVNLASDFIKEIHGLGARKIGFISTLPLGCMPVHRSSLMFCNETLNKAAQMYNAKLSTQIALLNNNLSESNIVYLDVSTPLLNLIYNPNKFGFQVANVGCCSVDFVSCPVPSTYVFWDLVHPTERSYMIIVNQTLATYFF